MTFVKILDSSVDDAPFISHIGGSLILNHPFDCDSGSVCLFTF